MKRKIIVQIISVFFVLVLLFACSNTNRKSKILTKEEMVAVLHDTYLAEAMYELRYSDFALNDKRVLLMDNILKKHGITQADFDSSLVWYSDNAELFARINDSVVNYLRRDLVDVQKLSNKDYNESNFNIINTYSFLSESNPLLNFVIDSMKIKEFPNFSFKFNTLGFDRMNDATFVVNYIYTDTVISDIQKISTDNLFASSFSENKLPQSLKSINGFIYADPKILADKKVLIYNIKVEK